jgi:lipoprotein Spr
MFKKAFCILVLSVWVFAACGPQPRFTSESADKGKGTHVFPGESGKKSESNINRAKMGRIINSFMGTPFLFGGETKEGIDCSGLVVQVYRQYAGFDLPRSTKKLYQLVKHVEEDDLVYGDLVFFSDGWFSVSHVGIYVEDRKFVHSSKELGVIVSSLDENYYRKRYRGARRVIP